MLNAIGGVLLYILPFTLVLTLVITIHELGHYWAARAFRTRIDAFALGFGKSILKRTDRHGTEWRVGWLPLGGYVKFAGDLDASSVPDQAGLDELKGRILAAEGPAALRDYFHFKPIWQRAIIVAAGPIANFILAVALFTALFSVVGVYIQPPRVAEVTAGSPAAQAGLQVGDRIVSVDGREVEGPQDVIREVRLNAGSPLRLAIDRAGEPLLLTVTPTRAVIDDPLAGRARVGTIGAALGVVRAEVTHVRYNPIEAVAKGADQVVVILDTTLTYLGRIVTGRESGDQLSGPIGIAKASGDVARQAASQTEVPSLQAANVALNLLQLAAILSVGIGFLNLLPIPVLDGGHLLFYGYEAVARKPVAARVQEMSYRVGLALLVCLMLFATWNDLQKLSLFQFLGGLA